MIQANLTNVALARLPPFVELRAPRRASWRRLAPAQAPDLVQRCAILLRRSVSTLDRRDSCFNERRQGRRNPSASALAVQPITRDLQRANLRIPGFNRFRAVFDHPQRPRSEEHTSELQSLMRNSY